MSLHTPFPRGTPRGATSSGGFEDNALLLAQYYNMPATSIRNALFTWLAARASPEGLTLYT